MRGLRSLAKPYRWALAAAVIAGAALRLAYVVVTRGHALAGDETAYHGSAVLQEAGKWFWSDIPYGIPHESFQKAPGYQVWTGVWYELVGVVPDRVFAVQALLLGPLVILLTFVLGRRLFGDAAGLGSAWLAALHPNVWQFEVRLYSESLATPITVALFVLALTCRPARRVVIGAGLLLGLLMLIRPTGFLVVPAFAIVWAAAEGARRGLLASAAVALIALLVVVPWSIRNATVDPDHFVPISIQDAAGYGVFNDDAARDDELPWKWRPVPARDRDLFDRRDPLADGELRAELQERMRDYIADNPSSVPKAWWHNGVLRLWDIGSPSQSVDAARFGGLTREVTAVGLGVYYLTLPFAALGLWGLWRTGRRRVVLALAAVAFAASLVYTSDAGTRYRAPLEPVICVLAAGGAAALLKTVRDRRRTTAPASA